MNNFLCWSAMVVDNISYGIRGVATNSGLGGGGGAGSNRDFFCIVSTNVA